MISFSPPTKFGEQVEAKSLPWPADYKPSVSPARSVFWTRHKPGIGMDHAQLAMLVDFSAAAGDDQARRRSCCLQR